METRTLNIPNISCGHCTAAIERELKEMSGVAEVAGDIGAKTVTVKWEAPATLAEIRATLKEINYPAAD